MNPHRRAAPIVMFLLLALAGCGGGRSSQFYRLSPVPAPPHGATLEPDAVVLLDVHVADYLERPQLLTAEGEYEFHVEEYHRWAEPVGQSIESVMRDNLRSRLDTPAVVLAPFVRPSGADYRIIVRVERMDVDRAGHCVLDCSWVFARASAPAKVLAREAESRRFEADVDGKIDKKDFSPYMAVMSRLLGELSDAIAESARSEVQGH